VRLFDQPASYIYIYIYIYIHLVFYLTNLENTCEDVWGNMEVFLFIFSLRCSRR
jgi:hypothetical protein